MNIACIKFIINYTVFILLGPVVQSVVSLTSSLRVHFVNCFSRFNIQYSDIFCWKNVSSFCTAKATHIFFSKKFQHICISLDVNFNESLTNDIVSFEQLGPVLLTSLGKMFFPWRFVVNANSFYASEWQFTKTCLFKYTENFTTQKMKIFRYKILIFFIFLLKA